MTKSLSYALAALFAFTSTTASSNADSFSTYILNPDTNLQGTHEAGGGIIIASDSAAQASGELRRCPIGYTETSGQCKKYIGKASCVRPARMNAGECVLIHELFNSSNYVLEAGVEAPMNYRKWVVRGKTKIEHMNVQTVYIHKNGTHDTYHNDTSNKGTQRGLKAHGIYWVQYRLGEEWHKCKFGGRLEDAMFGNYACIDYKPVGEYWVSN